MTTQGGQAGVIVMSRTRQRMVSGSAIAMEFHCPYSGNVIEEIFLDEGVRVSPNGRFSYRDPSFRNIKHIDGVFLTPRLARGTLWGVVAGPRVHTCHVRSKHPVRFRAIYVSQTRP